MPVSIVSFSAATSVNESGESGSSKVEANFSGSSFKVAVPTVLPIDVDENNNVTVATDARIVNSGSGAVEVTNATVEGQNDWSIVDFETDFKKVPVNTKQYGMIINNSEVATDGNLPVTGFNKIDGGDSHTITYDANVAIQGEPINKAIVGKVVFTVAWYHDYLDSSKNFTLEKNEIAPVLKVQNMSLREAIDSPDNHLFISHSISLDGSIGLIYYLNLTDEQVNSGARINFSWASIANSNYEYTIKPSDKDKATGLYKAKVDLAVAEMANNVHACVYVNNVLQDETDDYDIRTHGMSVINAPDGTYQNQEKLKELVVRMLDYGAKAQIVFNVNSNDLANKDVENYEMPQATVAMIDAAIFAQNGRYASDMKANNDSIGLGYYGTTIIFLSKTTLRHIYTIKNQSIYDSVKNNTSFTLNESKLPYASFEKSNIPADELDKLQEFTIGGQTYYYSVLDYSKSIINNSKNTVANKNLAMATYWYNQAANDYFDD